MNSKLDISTKLTPTGKTELDRYFVSPPFKLLTLPNCDPHWQQGLNAIQMSSSPGLLAKDRLEINIQLAPYTALSLGTQAFTRVQAMNAGDYAQQHTTIQLGEQSRLFYLPHPLVLHKDSALTQTTRIEMGGDSQLIYGEIVAIGRVLNDERFAFRHFSSYLQIFHQNRPLLVDRIQWQPSKMSLTALSQMEGYSHQGSLVYLDLAKTALEIKQWVTILQAFVAEQGEMLIGVSKLNEAGLMVRVLGHRADNIEHLFKQIAEKLKQG